MSWIILSHGDCDGICSASLALSARKGSEVRFTNPVGLLNDLKSIRGSNLIIADIALDSRLWGQIVIELRRLNSTGQVIYLDHHPMPSGISSNNLPGIIIRGNDDSCTSELVYEYFKEEIDPELSRVAVYGAIGDYSDNTRAINEIVSKWDKRELYLESGILIAVLEGTHKKDYDFKRRLVALLSQNGLPSLNEDLVRIAVEESRVDEKMRPIVKRNVKTLRRIAYVENISWSLGKAATYARAYGGKMVGIGAESTDDYTDMSLRSIGSVDLNEIVSRVAEKLDGNGGGHKNAAGAGVPKALFGRFLSDIDQAAFNQFPLDLNWWHLNT